MARHLRIHADNRWAPAFTDVAFHGTWDNDALLRSGERVCQYTALSQRSVALFDRRGLAGIPPNAMDQNDHGLRIATLQEETGGGIALLDWGRSSNRSGLPS